MNTQGAGQVRRRYWDVDEFAEFLGVSRHWVYKRTQSNGPETIPHSKFGKFLRFDPQSQSYRIGSKNTTIKAIDRGRRDDYIQG